MRVILKQDVKKVGKKGEIVEVADGYARNFLIGRGLAVAETKRSLEILDDQKAKAAAADETARRQAEALAAKMADMTLDFTVKTGAEDKVFGSVSTKQIAQALEKEGISIDKRKIIDASPIQSLGVTKVRIELYKGVTAVVKVRLRGSDN